MPDVLELFETTTRDLRLEPGALERQHRRQRRHRAVRNATVVVVVAAVVAAAGLLLTSAWPIGEQRIPAKPPPALSQAHEPYLILIDAATGRVAGGDGLIRNVAPDSSATISPDGSRVAFARPYQSSEQIYVTTHGGTTAMRISGPGKSIGCVCGSSQPAWSPDGSRIAFAGTDQKVEQGIYVVDLATGDARRVTQSGRFETEPTWSPDGRSIAFVRTGHSSRSLWIVDVATGHLSHVSPLPAENPAWSPDGRSIAFSRVVDNAGETGVWLIHPDGSGLRRVTDAAVESDGSLSWSPDGRLIAFATTRLAGQAPRVDIAVVNVATSRLQTIARGFDYPAWSPDGRSILVLGP